MSTPLNFTCSACGHVEELQDDSVLAIVNARREQVMSMLSHDGGRNRGVVAFDEVRDPETGETKLVARRRLGGIEIK